jgi:predicted secreted hydrolase
MMRRTAVRIALAAVVVSAALAIVWLSGWLEGSSRRTDQATIAVAEALGAPAEGFARAEVPRPFLFPADHGPHPEFRTEWWYYTGNVASADGRAFGYQLTFFRIALAPPGGPRASAWATREVWMAHFAVTDVAGARFAAVSRFARGAVGLAGAEPAPFRVWVEDWSAAGVSDAATPAMRLVAREGDIAIDLVLEPVKPAVPQGDHGLSRKGPDAASYYYSLTRLATRGDVTIGSERIRVSGLSWMDREWSTSALATDQAGWDWFALQLDDGRELMYYRLRRTDGSTDRFSGGTVIAADGTVTPLDAGDVVLDVVATWRSPGDGARYPSRWRLAVPGAGLTLDVEPRVADQEWRRPVRYWEGAVTARGSGVSGVGYVELVGYATGSRRP